MTILRCGKHQNHFDSERYATCPICDRHALHPDPELAISALQEALGGLYTKRWADAQEDERYVQQLSDIAKASAELVLMVDGLCREIDWPAEQATSTVSHNQERLGA